MEFLELKQLRNPELVFHSLDINRFVSFETRNNLHDGLRLENETIDDFCLEAKEVTNKEVTWVNEN